MKKSFLMHHDACAIFKELSDENAGKLIKEIIDYSIYKTQSEPVEPSGLSGLLNALAIQFKNQIDRDLENYLKICERNKNNGKKGGRKPKKTQANPVKADKDKDKDKDIQKENTKRKAANELEIINFCLANGLTRNDGEQLWLKWTENNWTNSNKKINDWKLTILAWKKAGYLPSQKNPKPEQKEEYYNFG